MKTAILISGIIKGNWERNKKLIQSAFPDADIFTSTWKNAERSDEVDYVFAQPSVDYHPTLDTQVFPKFKSISLKKSMENNPNIRDRGHPSWFTSLQILGHDKLLNEVCPNDEYDMIIRVRYDTYLELNNVDWKGLVERSYEKNITLGFGNRDTRWRFGTIKKVPEYYPPVDTPIFERGVEVSNDWAYYVMDPLIIHPRKLWDSKRVWDLHYQEKLHGAENGWFQILSEPYGHNHECYYGVAHIDRFLGR